MSGDHNMHCSANQLVTWTARELELLDGMIEVQLKHADRCDNIRNTEMAQAQKQWDMERVELLRKVRGMSQREWVGITDNEITQCWLNKHDHDIGALYAFACAIEAKLRDKNNG
jgi:hypothetical protein